VHFERYFFAVQLPVVQAKISDLGLTKLAAAVCMHSIDSKRWQTQACWKVEVF